jgi:hypothetical protein
MLPANCAGAQHDCSLQLGTADCQWSGFGPKRFVHNVEARGRIGSNNQSTTLHDRSELGHEHFLAQNSTATYALSPTELLVTSGQTVIKHEPTIEYREPRR